MTQFNVTTVVASALIAGALMAGGSYAASAVIVPNDNSITCGTNKSGSGNCGDTKAKQGNSATKSLVGTGDSDSGGHEGGGNDGDDD